MSLVAPTLGSDPGDDMAASARLVTLVRRAAAVLPTTWPLETFIAVNPLAGFEDLPFEDGGLAAADIFGAAPTLDEATFRQLYATGTIDDGALRVAVRDAVGTATGTVVGSRPDGMPVTLGDLVMADLLHGQVPAPGPVEAQTLAARSDRLLGTELVRSVDDEASWWVATVVGGGSGQWDTPDLHLGLYRSWRAAAGVDHRLPRAVRRLVTAAPDDPRRAVLVGLDRCADDTEAGAFLQHHLVALPGWASLLRHRGTDALVDYLALRITLERALVTAAGVLDQVTAVPAPPVSDRPGSVGSRLADALAEVGATEDDLTPEGRLLVVGALDRVPVERRRFVWLDAHERGYRSALLDGLGRTEPAPRPAPRHAAVFCIDPRSEGLRRHLESDGGIATFGFAGFFAVAMSYQDVAGGEASPQCPVLVEPRVLLGERPSDGAVEGVARDLRGRRVAAGARDGFHEAKDDLVGPYALADAGGWVAGPLAVARTLAAGTYGRVRAAAGRALVPGAATQTVPEVSLTLEEQVLLARVFLTSTGLHRAGARLVLVCGHGSTTENNPYRSSLDCGACGGHRGAPNARVAAGVLNRDEVRQALAERGIDVGDDTWFVAGEHDTATDEVRLLDQHLVPPSHRADLDDLQLRLGTAGRGLVVERAGAFPGNAPGSGRGRTVAAVRRRSVDWAQVLPEWGLAGNAAFVVAPRSLTEGVDLGRRVFLHSYDPGADSGGDALETILTAPMVVAQWINCQYYFSSVAPDVFGAGTKVVHNVTAGSAGVVAGAGGDLRIGLPWQSVAWGGQLVHEPLRLLTVVEAPLARIDAVIERNQVLRRLFGNGWVALAARGGPDDTWHERRRDGSWRTWDGTDLQEAT